MVKKGNKLGFVLPIIVLLVFSLIFASTISLVAATPDTQCFAENLNQTSKISGEAGNFSFIGSLKDPLGYLSGTGTGGENFGTFFGWMFIIVVLIFAYEAFAFIKIPKSAFLRAILSLVIAFGAAMVVSKTEIYTALLSYGAAGIALFLALPILVLAAFSVMVAYKADPFGLLLQKIIWIIFGSYLIIKSTVLLFIKSQIFNFTSMTAAWAPDGWACQLVNFFGVKSFYNANYDSTILLIHIIVAIAAFAIFVVWNDKTEAYLQQYFKDQEIKKLRDELDRQGAKRSAEAESTKVMGK